MTDEPEQLEQFLLWMANSKGAKMAMTVTYATDQKFADGWNTDTLDFAAAIAEFEVKLPGFWWSVGQCSVGAHASCAVDGKGAQADLLNGVMAGEPLDAGFHCDTSGGSPAEALRDVMRQALKYLKSERL
jgi:hypothetical protein